MIEADWLSRLEWIAALLGAVNIALLVFRSMWNFPFGMAMVALYALIFWESRLYAEAGLQVFFFAAQGWGWWLWARAEKGIGSARVAVYWMDWPSRLLWVVATAAISLNLGWVLHSFTNAALPYADAGIAGASVAAQVLLAFRRIENWVLWIAIDVAAITLYIDRGLYPTAGLYGGFLVMSLFGLREWVVAHQRQAAPAIEA